jgi:hypothetical protein
VAEFLTFARLLSTSVFGSTFEFGVSLVPLCVVIFLAFISASKRNLCWQQQ